MFKRIIRNVAFSMMLIAVGIISVGCFWFPSQNDVEDARQEWIEQRRYAESLPDGQEKEYALHKAEQLEKRYLRMEKINASIDKGVGVAGGWLDKLIPGAGALLTTGWALYNRKKQKKTQADKSLMETGLVKQMDMVLFVLKQMNPGVHAKILGYLKNAQDSMGIRLDVKKILDGVKIAHNRHVPDVMPDIEDMKNSPAGYMTASEADRKA